MPVYIFCDKAKHTKQSGNLYRTAVDAQHGRTVRGVAASLFSKLCTIGFKLKKKMPLLSTATAVATVILVSTIHGMSVVFAGRCCSSCSRALASQAAGATTAWCDLFLFSLTAGGDHCPEKLLLVLILL